MEILVYHMNGRLGGWSVLHNGLQQNFSLCHASKNLNRTAMKGDGNGDGDWEKAMMAMVISIDLCPSLITGDAKNGDSDMEGDSNWESWQRGVEEVVSGFDGDSNGSEATMWKTIATSAL